MTRASTTTCRLTPTTSAGSFVTDSNETTASFSSSSFRASSEFTSRRLLATIFPIGVSCGSMMTDPVLIPIGTEDDKHDGNLIFWLQEAMSGEKEIEMGVWIEPHTTRTSLGELWRVIEPWKFRVMEFNLGQFGGYEGEGWYEKW